MHGLQQPGVLLKTDSEFLSAQNGCFSFRPLWLVLSAR